MATLTRTPVSTSQFTNGLTPGVVFSTPFESGCVVVTSPDQFGNFDAMDSDMVLCNYGVGMVTGIQG